MPFHQDSGYKPSKKQVKFCLQKTQMNQKNLRVGSATSAHTRLKMSIWMDMLLSGCHCQGMGTTP
jgi:hypothetical protein